MKVTIQIPDEHYTEAYGEMIGALEDWRDRTRGTATFTVLDVADDVCLHRHIEMQPSLVTGEPVMTCTDCETELTRAQEILDAILNCASTHGMAQIMTALAREELTDGEYTALFNRLTIAFKDGR